ncbi:MAG: hypothetical protein O3A91_11925, partial [Proteobacteria bacterium]|nr:hypothetical protein [Pseudomonadota bacterium]
MKITLELPEELLQRIKPEFFGEQFREGGWYPVVSLAFEGVYRKKCGPPIADQLANRIESLKAGQLCCQGLGCWNVVRLGSLVLQVPFNGGLASRNDYIGEFTLGNAVCFSNLQDCSITAFEGHGLTVPKPSVQGLTQARVDLVQHLTTRTKLH